MKRTCSALVAMAIACTCASEVRAGFKDFYWTDPNPPGPYAPTPLDPTDPLSGWSWDSSTWTHMNATGEVPDGTVIRPGEFRMFGLENLYVGEDWVKQFWVTFRYQGGQPGSVDYGYGYHPVHQTHGHSSAYSSPGSPTNPVFTLRVTVKPQPDWEWVSIKNVGTTDMTISMFKMDSECTPAPGAMPLLLLGLAGLTRRRA